MQQTDRPGGCSVPRCSGELWLNACLAAAIVWKSCICTLTAKRDWLLEKKEVTDKGSCYKNHIKTLKEVFTLPLLAHTRAQQMSYHTAWGSLSTEDSGLDSLLEHWAGVGGHLEDSCHLKGKHTSIRAEHFLPARREALVHNWACEPQGGARLERNHLSSYLACIWDELCHYYCSVKGPGSPGISDLILQLLLVGHLGWSVFHPLHISASEEKQRGPCVQQHKPTKGIIKHSTCEKRNP